MPSVCSLGMYVCKHCTCIPMCVGYIYVQPCWWYVHMSVCACVWGGGGEAYNTLVTLAIATVWCSYVRTYVDMCKLMDVRMYIRTYSVCKCRCYFPLCCWWYMIRMCLLLSSLVAVVYSVLASSYYVRTYVHMYVTLHNVQWSVLFVDVLLFPLVHLQWYHCRADSAEVLPCCGNAGWVMYS